MFLPKKLKVGFNAREDCYTKKLAYIIYYDEKGKLRKKTSWNSWRKEELGDDEYDNSPTEGFVLNKTAGGKGWSSWNTRNIYARVYDPRGFEFEISIPNLLFILQNASSHKGKGLEGEYAYGWEGTELWLIPVDAPEYSEWTSTSKILLSNTTIKAKDLVAGYTYMTKQEEQWIYLGRFTEYDSYRQREDKPMIKKYWFVNVKQTKAGADKEEKNRWNKNYYENFTSLSVNTITSVPQKIVYCLSEDIHPEYPEVMEALEHNRSYVGLGETSKVESYVYEDFMEEFPDSDHYYRSVDFYDSEGKSFYVRKRRDNGQFEKCIKVKQENARYHYNDYKEEIIATYPSILELFETEDCNYKDYYLSNGKIGKTSRTYDISLKYIIGEETNE